jgi:hypothetical protein
MQDGNNIHIMLVLGWAILAVVDYVNVCHVCADLEAMRSEMRQLREMVRPMTRARASFTCHGPSGPCTDDVTGVQVGYDGLALPQPE